MPFEVNIAGSGVRLVLTGRLGVQQAKPLWDRLQTCIASAAPLSLDAENLVDMDTSIVQILFRLKHSTCSLHVDTVSAGFTDSMKRRGLEETFADDAVRIDSSGNAVSPVLLNLSTKEGHPNV